MGDPPSGIVPGVGVRESVAEVKKSPNLAAAAARGVLEAVALPFVAGGTLVTNTVKKVTDRIDKEMTR